MWHSIISQAIQLAALAIGAWIARALTTPKAKDTAQHLAMVAEDVVNLLVLTHPGATWDDYLKLAVQAIAQAAGLNVTDQAAITRAAAQALAQHGITPPK